MICVKVTSKKFLQLADTLIIIHQHVPMAERLDATRRAILLMPDENREALQTLVHLLRDIAKHAATNSVRGRMPSNYNRSSMQMTAANIAVCVAPSLFQLNRHTSPNRRQTLASSSLGVSAELQVWILINAPESRTLFRRSRMRHRRASLS